MAVKEFAMPKKHQAKKVVKPPRKRIGVVVEFSWVRYGRLQRWAHSQNKTTAELIAEAITLGLAMLGVIPSLPPETVEAPEIPKQPDDVALNDTWFALD